MPAVAALMLYMRMTVHTSITKKGLRGYPISGQPRRPDSHYPIYLHYDFTITILSLLFHYTSFYIPAPTHMSGGHTAYNATIIPPSLAYTVATPAVSVMITSLNDA